MAGNPPGSGTAPLSASAATKDSVGVSYAALHFGDPVTIGLFLKGLSDLVLQAIQAARNAGLTLEIEAGREVNLAIENARNAYLDLIDKTLSEVDKQVQGTLNQLKGMAEDLLNHLVENIDVFAARAQQLVNTLPFHNKAPQVTRVLPRFLAPSSLAYDALVLFDGNFEFAAEKGLTPLLEVNNRKYSPVANSTQQLKYQVTIADILAASPVGDPDKFSYARSRLSVPWKTGGFMGIGKKKKVSEYSTIVGLLPGSPGRITIRRTTHSSAVVKRDVWRGEHYQTSAEDGGNDDKKEVPWEETPAPGWHIVPGSSRFSFWDDHGDWSYSFRGDGGDKVVYWVTTIHKNFGSSGRVRFSIGFTEWQEIGVDATEDLQVQLKWGDSQSFSFPAGSWRVYFDAFDGSHDEFMEASQANPFLKVHATTTGLLLSAADPRTLNWQAH